MTLKSALSVFLISCLLGRPVQTELTVKRGEDATLQCYSPTDATIILLRWEKRGQQSDLYVFYVRDGRPNENYQLPSFKGRVKLKDPEWMKNGDFTVILKNVSVNDAGIYECHAGYSKQKPQILTSINLTVEESGSGGQSGDEGKEDGGEKSGPDGLIVGLSVSVVLLVVVVFGFMFYRKCKNQLNYQPPPDRDTKMLSAAS